MKKIEQYLAALRTFELSSEYYRYFSLADEQGKKEKSEVLGTNINLSISVYSNLMSGLLEHFVSVSYLRVVPKQ